MLVLSVTTAFGAMPGPYAPPAGTPGSTAVAYNELEQDPRIIGWATGYSSLTRGPMSNGVPSSPLASHGSPSDVFGPADAELDSSAVVSLGDGGQITVTFAQPFGNGPGPDFAVFENGFQQEGVPEDPYDFLELAFVEVSSDGVSFHRFASISLTQTDSQISAFGTLDTTYIHNLAGKYVRGFGTPFDLAELAGMDGLNIAAITHVRIIDVVGSINSAYGRLDSQGHLINDPWFTYDPEDPPDYITGGFDLDAVAIMNIPEPVTPAFCLLGFALCATRRRRKS